MSCLRPRADSDFAGDMLSTFAASERWLPVVRPLVTAQPVADCAPGVAVLVSKAVSEVLQPLRDAICGAALVVAPVTVATQFQQLTRQAAAKPFFVYVLVGAAWRGFTLTSRRRR